MGGSALEGVPYPGFRYTLQALLGTQAAGREKEGELVTTSLEFEFHLQFPCGSPSTALSDFRQSARSGNECECKQTLKNTWKHAPRVMTSLLMSSPSISISHRLSRCRDIQIPETWLQAILSFSAPQVYKKVRGQTSRRMPPPSPHREII